MRAEWDDPEYDRGMRGRCVGSLQSLRSVGMTFLRGMRGEESAVLL
jgi:hypothetical protein